MTVLFDQNVTTIDFEPAYWTPKLWTNCGAFYYELEVIGPNPSLITLVSNQTTQIQLWPSLQNSDAGIYNLTLLTITPGNENNPQSEKSYASVA